MLTIYNQNVWNHNPTAWRNGMIRSLIDVSGADICTFQECGPHTSRAGDAPLPVLMSDRFAEVLPDMACHNFTPVYYRKDRFRLLDEGYLLYEGRNDADSKSVTWAVLEDLADGHRFAAASTHFWWKFDDAEDNTQRLRNARQLQEICDAIIEKYDVPVIIGGDFNNGAFSEQGDEPYHAMLAAGFRDFRLIAGETTDTLTHHDYPVEQADGSSVCTALPVRTLDYLFVYGAYPVSVLKFDVPTSDMVLASSDHCPLLGTLQFCF